MLRRGVSGFNRLGLVSKTVRKIGLFKYSEQVFNGCTGIFRTGDFCTGTFDLGFFFATRNGGRVDPSNNGDGFLDLVDGFKFIHDMEKEKRT